METVFWDNIMCPGKLKNNVKTCSHYFLPATSAHALWFDQRLLKIISVIKALSCQLNTGLASLELQANVDITKNKYKKLG